MVAADPAILLGQPVKQDGCCMLMASYHHDAIAFRLGPSCLLSLRSPSMDFAHLKGVILSCVRSFAVCATFLEHKQCNGQLQARYVFIFAHYVYFVTRQRSCVIPMVGSIQHATLQCHQSA